MSLEERTMCFRMRGDGGSDRGSQIRVAVQWAAGRLASLHGMTVVDVHSIRWGVPDDRAEFDVEAIVIVESKR